MTRLFGVRVLAFAAWSAIASPAFAQTTADILHQNVRVGQWVMVPALGTK